MLSSLGSSQSSSTELWLTLAIVRPVGLAGAEPSCAATGAPMRDSTSAARATNRMGESASSCESHRCSSVECLFARRTWRPPSLGLSELLVSANVGAGVVVRTGFGPMERRGRRLVWGMGDAGRSESGGKRPAFSLGESGGPSGSGVRSGRAATRLGPV